MSFSTGTTGPSAESAFMSNPEFANINGQRIHYRDTGARSKVGLDETSNKTSDRPAVVFMHGFLMNQAMFDSQVAEIKNDFRCIRWDARGFGATEWDGKPFTLWDSASDCIGLMDHLGISSAILVGMSQGGYCALRTALQYPERVKGLVLMSTRSEVDEEPIKESYRGMRDLWMSSGPVDPLIEGLATAILGPQQAPGMAKHWDCWLPEWKKLSGKNIFHAMNALLDRDEITDRLCEIRCPALITHGSEDFAIPASCGESLSKRLSQSKGFVVSPGAHAPNLTHSEVITPALVQFLKNFQ